MQPTLADLETIYRMEYPRFLRVAEAITGDPHLAADAVNDAFAGAIHQRDRFRRTGTLESWLWACVVNAARSMRRRRRRTSGEDGLDGVAAPEPAADHSGLRALVADLPERQRLALFLRYYADLDYREIAAVLGVEIGTISATLSKAHGTVRRRLVEVSA